MSHLTELWHRVMSNIHFDPLTLFGLVAVSAMLIFYALEDSAHPFILGFAVACLMGSAYGFLQGAWPFGLVEGIWTIIAVRKWLRKRTGMRGVSS